MQLTGPLFLFLFFPLSLPLVIFCPQKYRKIVLSLVSIAWYVLANLGSPFAMLQIAAVILLVSLFAALPEGGFSRLRCAAGVALPLIVFTTARLLAEYGPASYPYPAGLTFVTLGAVSLSIDRYRGDAPDRDDPLSVAGYLLFFPALTLGPILRYKQYLYMIEHARPSYARFSTGAGLFLLGFVKRIAVAAVLWRALADLLSFPVGALDLSAVAFALALSFFLFCFFVSGCTDMARGLMAIYGLQPPRGHMGLLTATTPARLLYGILLSLDRYLEDYVAGPIKRRIPGIPGKLVACVPVFALTMLFWRFRPEALLFFLPILLISLLTVRQRRYSHAPRKLWLRAICILLSCAAISVFALSLVLGGVRELIDFVRAAAQSKASYPFEYVYSAIADRSYLLLAGAVLAVLLTFQYAWPHLSRRVPRRVRVGVQIVMTAVIFLAFLGTLVHFLPQFPQYADGVWPKLYL